MQKPKPGYKLVESLFGKYEEIPEEWDFVAFGTIAQIKRGASPRPIENPEYFGNGRGWIRISDVTKSNKYLEKTTDYLSTLGESKSVPVNEGDLIMSIAASVGKPILLKMKACIHDGFIAFSNLSPQVDAEFLFYLLTKLESKIKSLGQHGTQSNVNANIVSKIIFAKPPLKEQQKIVAILSNVDNLIESYDFIIQNIVKLKHGLMQALLTRGIGHKKFKKVKWYFGKEIEIPEEWEVKKLKEISKRVSVGHVGITSEFYCDKNKGVLFLRSQNVRNGKLNLGEALYINSDFDSQLKKSQLRGGDLLIVRVGANRADSCIVPENMEKCNCANIIFARPHNINSKYLDCFFQSIFCKNLLLNLSVGAAQEVINTKDVQNIQVFVPPLQEQQKIVTILYEIDSKISELESKKLHFESLKKGLMQKLLTGQLMVAA